MNAALSARAGAGDAGVNPGHTASGLMEKS